MTLIGYMQVSKDKIEGLQAYVILNPEVVIESGALSFSGHLELRAHDLE